MDVGMNARQEAESLRDAVTDLMESDPALRAVLRALVDAEAAADRLFTALQKCAEREDCCRGGSGAPRTS